MEQLFLLIQRNLNGKVHSEAERDFLTAVAKQQCLLVGLTDIEFQKSMLTKEEVEAIALKLKENGQYRLCNDEEEVVLFYLPKRNKMR